ncbi:MAG: hypothetical protein PHV33_14805 [Elusimicrobiales bacterium]|nr:hypothetical protein [Elusimicrobiales bacterium]
MLKVLLLALALAPGAAAQWVPPDIEVTRLSAGEYAHIEEDETVVGTEYDLSALKAKSAASEDVAGIRVVFKGKWFQGADYLAREKAAALGANYLVLVKSIGDEDLGAGAARSYRAVRLTGFNKRPLYIKPPEQSFSPAQPAAQYNAPPQNPAAPEAAAPEGGHAHFTWAWGSGAYALSNSAVFDTVLAESGDIEELKQYVRENFGSGERKKLLAAVKKRSRIIVDFKKKEVR